MGGGADNLSLLKVLLPEIFWLKITRWVSFILEACLIRRKKEK